MSWALLTLGLPISARTRGSEMMVAAVAKASDHCGRRFWPRACWKTALAYGRAMVRRSAMVDLKPRGQLVEQLGGGARLDLAPEDPGPAADRERPDLPAPLLARLLRLHPPPGTR